MKAGHEPDVISPTSLPSTRRRLAISLFVAAIVGGSAFSLITQRDYWPFSHYPMFAGLQGPRLEFLEVIGIRADEGEVQLAPSRFTSLVAGTRHREALELLVERGDESQVRAFLGRAARAYEASRASDMPALKAVRLYRSQWGSVPEEWPPVRRLTRVRVAELDLGP